MGDAMVSAGGIIEKDIAALLASTEPAAPVELTVEQEMQRRKTMHELDFLFGGLGSFSRGKGSPPRVRRPVETAEARARREELLYESVIRIFELQLKQERREAESRRRQRAALLLCRDLPSVTATIRPAPRQWSVDKCLLNARK
jgi:hypothetical protein